MTPVAEPPGAGGPASALDAVERPDDDRLGGEVVQILREALGGSLVGAYLHGSAVRGQLRPTSDLDILAVVDRPTTADERKAIVGRLLQISGRLAADGPARPVELLLIQQGQLKPWHPAPLVDLVYGEWLRADLAGGAVPEPKAMPDLGPEVTVVLAGNRALFGPPPREVLDPVPRTDVRRAVVAGIPSLLSDLDVDQRNVLLTLARVLVTLETDEIVSKEEAAELVAHRLSPASQALLLTAREMYVEGVSDEAAGAAWAASKPAAREAATELISEIAGFETG